MIKKQTYLITIEEHCSSCFAVQASHFKEAMEIAESKYQSGEFVVDPTPPSCRLMMAQDKESNQLSEWVEF